MLSLGNESHFAMGSRLPNFKLVRHAIITLPAIFLGSFLLAIFASHSFTPVYDGSAANSEINVEIDPVMSLAITDNTGTNNIDTMSMEVTPSVSGTFVSSSALVKASTNNETGYTLTMSNNDDNTNLVSSTASTTIPSITTNSTNTSDIELNKWGYSFGTTTLSSSFNPIPALSSPQTLASTTTPADDAHPFTVASKIGMETESGIYQDTLVFTLTANYVAPKITAGKIIYHDNGANSPTTMGEQVPSSTDTANLWPSNFQRAGYGFAGWNTKANGTGTSYGPMETITLPANFTTNGLELYAMWIPSAGNIQDWTGCSTLAQGAVTALTDIRDNDVYAVAKLADGNCWMIENLRLDYNANENTSGSLAQGYAASTTYGNFSGLAQPETDFSSYGATANSLYYYETQSGTASIDIGTTSNPFDRFPRYNNDNTGFTITNMTSITNQNIYSYGNYYTWAAATANLGWETYGGARKNTSICPSGWRIPDSGGLDPKIGSFNFLFDFFQNDYSVWRKFPNNYILSGSYQGLSAYNKGSYGYYWSNNGYSTHAQILSLHLDGGNPGSMSHYKRYGATIRCLAY